MAERTQSTHAESSNDSELLKKWECPICTFENDPTHSICDICRSGKRPAAGDLWLCSRCTFQNNKALTHCKVCSGPRDAPLEQQSYEAERPPPQPVQPVPPVQRVQPVQPDEPSGGRAPRPLAQAENPFDMMAKQNSQRQQPPPPVAPGRRVEHHDDPFADPGSDPAFVEADRMGGPGGPGMPQPMNHDSSDGLDGLPSLPPQQPSGNGPQAMDIDIDDAKFPPVPQMSVEQEQELAFENFSQAAEADAATQALIAQMMNQEACAKCQSRADFALPCNHLACRNCVSNYLRTGLVRQTWKNEPVACPVDGCDVALPTWVINSSGISESHRTKIEEMQTFFLTSQMDNLIKCPKCPNVFEGEAGDVTQPHRRSQAAAHQVEIGLDGKPLTLEAAQHKASYRFRCANCQTIFCKQCKVFPYHLGYTCQSWESYQAANKCRFCGKRLERHNTAHPDPRNDGPGLQSVCTDVECIEKRALSCPRLLRCGHPCCGIKGERAADCLPCLVEEDCPNSQGCDGEDYCNICWVESLNQAPCVRLNCGHFFHFACVREKIEKKWPGARVTFGFLNCPLCKQEINHPAISQLAQEYFQLKEKIKTEAVERLEIEGLHEDPRLRDRNSPYFNNREAFALDRLAYYLCYKCGKPYFGGMRACEEAGAQQDEKYNAEHLVCPACAAGPNSKSCPTHGKKYITYKCKFCCSIASWFCWGNTHFCDSCHKRQERGDYLNRKPISDLPQCPGMPDCPLGVDHPPNGVEDFALGCVVCLRR